MPLTLSKEAASASFRPEAVSLLGVDDIWLLQAGHRERQQEKILCYNNFA
jgi:hypothetical protein